MKRPSAAEIKYRSERAEAARVALLVAQHGQMGATVINRRRRTWQIRVAELEAALARVKVAA